MFAEIPHKVVLLATGAFLLGWVLASISARIGARYQARKRDARDDRIRALEAEHRISQSSLEDLRRQLEGAQKDLQLARDDVAKRDNVIDHQHRNLEKLKTDLRESVRKTRQLRDDLKERATENLRAEVKQRELETELSIAQASTDLIATGVLDYSFNDDDEDAASGHRPATKSAS
jgi:chromosome segregation ATPase